MADHRSAESVIKAFQTQRGALQRLHDIIYSELRVELGRHDLAEIVSSSRAELMKVVTQRSNEKASSYGIQILDVRIKRADLPEQNEKAVFARMQAERERQAKQYRAEGAEEAQKIRSDAEKDREIILAEAYKESRRAEGKRGRQSLSDLRGSLSVRTRISSTLPARWKPTRKHLR